MSNDHISVDEFLSQIPGLIADASMHPIEKKRRLQQLAENTLSPRKVLRLHVSGERNIDSVESKLKATATKNATTTTGEKAGGVVTGDAFCSVSS